MTIKIGTILFGSALTLCVAAATARAAGTFTLQQNQITPNQVALSSQLPYWTTWTRPSSAAAAASTSTVYAEWDGFTDLGATNEPTGNSAFGPTLTTIPTAGDTTSANDGSFLIGGEGQTSSDNPYYSPSTGTSDIYSFSSIISPQITVPEYNIAGDQLNVLVQVQSYGSAIYPTGTTTDYAGDTVPALSVNSVDASSLPDYSETITKTDGGTEIGFGDAYTNDYAWTFTLPVDPSSLVLDFGWGVTSAALDAAVIDTQSVPVSVPEPASISLIGLASALFLRRTRRPVCV